MRGAKYNPQTTPQLCPEVRIAPLNRHAVALRIAVAIQMGVSQNWWQKLF
jgi:hypothetical protein